jgi:hypothetical protein
MVPSEGLRERRQVFEKALFADVDESKMDQVPARRDCLHETGERYVRCVDAKVYDVGRPRAEFEVFHLTLRHGVDVEFSHRWYSK